MGEDTGSDTSASVVVSDDRVGTNACVARMIQEAVGGDLHAIIAAEPYPADFDEVVDINHQEDSRAISMRNYGGREKLGDYRNGRGTTLLR